MARTRAREGVPRRASLGGRWHERHAEPDARRRFGKGLARSPDQARRPRGADIALKTPGQTAGKSVTAVGGGWRKSPDKSLKSLGGGLGGSRRKSAEVSLQAIEIIGRRLAEVGGDVSPQTPLRAYARGASASPPLAGFSASRRATVIFNQPRGLSR